MKRFFLFVTNLTRAIFTDRSCRRRAMFQLLSGALILLIGGTLVLDHFLAVHPFGFLIYWMICLWLTITALLLALFDLLKTKSPRS